MVWCDGAFMKRFLLLFVVALVLVLTGCGGATKSIGTDSRTSTEVGSADRDKDNDFGSSDDTNNDSVLEFTHPASAVNHGQIIALLKSYYAAAAVDDGVSACSMVYSTLAESLPEDDGMAPGPLYLRGAKTCSEVLGLMFKHAHSLLVAENERFKTARVFLNGDHGIAILNFGNMPERQITIAREGPQTWKVATVLDRELP